MEIIIERPFSIKNAWKDVINAKENEKYKKYKLLIRKMCINFLLGVLKGLLKHR